MRYAVKISTTNIDGNPRRGWWIYTGDGTLIGFKDEGYTGDLAQVDEDFDDGAVTIELGHIHCTVEEYRRGDRMGWSDPRVVTIASLPIYGIDPTTWCAFDGHVPAHCDLAPTRGALLTVKQARVRLAQGLLCSAQGYACGRGDDPQGVVLNTRARWLVTRI